MRKEFKFVEEGDNDDKVDDDDDKADDKVK